MAAVQAAEYNGDEWDLAWYLLWGIYTNHIWVLTKPIGKDGVRGCNKTQGILFVTPLLER